MTDPEPELIESPLNCSIERGGRRIKVNILRLATQREWSLEVVNDHNTTITWDDQFDTDRDADAAFRRALADDGFEAFLDKRLNRRPCYQSRGSAAVIGRVRSRPQVHQKNDR